MIAAGFDGIERGLNAGEPNSANLYKMSAADREAAGIEVLPGNLLDATRELAGNAALRAGLGKTPDGDYVDYFIQSKQREIRPPTSRLRSGSWTATCSSSKRGLPRRRPGATGSGGAEAPPAGGGRVVGDRDQRGHGLRLAGVEETGESETGAFSAVADLLGDSGDSFFAVWLPTSPGFGSGGLGSLLRLVSLVDVLGR